MSLLARGRRIVRRRNPGRCAEDLAVMHQRARDLPLHFDVTTYNDILDEGAAIILQMELEGNP